MAFVHFEAQSTCVAGRCQVLSQVILEHLQVQLLMVFGHFEVPSTSVAGPFQALSWVFLVGFHCCIVQFLTPSTSFWMAGTLRCGISTMYLILSQKEVLVSAVKRQKSAIAKMSTLMELSGVESASGTVEQRPKKRVFQVFVSAFDWFWYVAS